MNDETPDRLEGIPAQYLPGKHPPKWSVLLLVLMLLGFAGLYTEIYFLSAKRPKRPYPHRMAALRPTVSRNTPLIWRRKTCPSRRGRLRDVSGQGQDRARRPRQDLLRMGKLAAGASNTSARCHFCMKQNFSIPNRTSRPT